VYSLRVTSVTHPAVDTFGADVDADEVRARLDRFPGTERGQIIARARAAATAGAAISARSVRSPR
jgi:hypothetical protein